MEQAIVALAPYSRYWHCKNLYRVHVPETERAYFIGVPLPDGDIDYHFAIFGHGRGRVTTAIGNRGCKRRRPAPQGPAERRVCEVGRGGPGPGVSAQRSGYRPHRRRGTSICDPTNRRASPTASQS